MIKLCKNLFYKPKYGSEADSLILKHLFSTVTVILVCLAAISISAYAYFSYSVTSAANTIQSSSFSATVSINPHMDPSSSTDDTETYPLKPDEYTVTITTDTGITGTGYYIVNIAGTDYYTQQLGVDLNAPGQERTQISFILKINTATDVTFESHWGTSSHYSTAPIAENEAYIMNADPLQVIVVGDPVSSDKTDSDKTDSDDTASNDATEETTPEQVIHTVMPDENLAKIAQLYGTTYPRIIAYNNLENPSIIRPGDKIIIPPTDWVMPEETTATTEPVTTEPVATEPAATEPVATEPVE